MKCIPFLSILFFSLFLLAGCGDPDDPNLAQGTITVQMTVSDLQQSLSYNQSGLENEVEYEWTVFLTPKTNTFENLSGVYSIRLVHFKPLTLSESEEDRIVTIRNSTTGICDDTVDPEFCFGAGLYAFVNDLQAYKKSDISVNIANNTITLTVDKADFSGLGNLTANNTKILARTTHTIYNDAAGRVEVYRDFYPDDNEPTNGENPTTTFPDYIDVENTGDLNVADLSSDCVMCYKVGITTTCDNTNDCTGHEFIDLTNITVSITDQ